MAARRRKKSRKLRGRTRTMGWGRVGQHRKSGSRGGVGAVGFHKHKWSWIMKYARNWYGKEGFLPRGKRAEAPEVNVGFLDEYARKLASSGAAKVVDGKVEINVVELGYAKVTGSGKVTTAMRVIAKAFTEEAKRKIEEAGGEAVVLGALGQ
ncbi:MAG: uL15 family ribosomal protein [Desulfurococcaceae archaeon]